MLETTSYTLTGQADLRGTIRRLLAENPEIDRWRLRALGPAGTMIARLQATGIRAGKLGALMRELHARGRLDGFKVRR